MDFIIILLGLKKKTNNVYEIFYTIFENILEGKTVYFSVKVPTLAVKVKIFLRKKLQTW